MSPFSRRQFLHLSAAAAAAAALGAGCSSEADAPSADAGTGASPTTTAPRSKGKLTDVEHVVILFQENRSFDQYFGTRPGVRGFADPDVLRLPDGRPIWYQPRPEHPDGYVLPYAQTANGPGGQCGIDPDHSWAGQHAAWNGGKMDGYARTMGEMAMGYFRRQDLPWYHALADEFTLCTRWFSSVMGPANPNRVLAVSGTIDPFNKAGGPAVDNLGTRYGWETYPERLQRAGIGWKVYQGADAGPANPLRTFVQFEEARPGDPLYRDAMQVRGIDAFETDCAEGTLPWVSWVVVPDAVTPNGGVSVVAQQGFLARAVGAVMANPDVWSKTMVIVTHDTSGGFFDHMPPPTPVPSPGAINLDFVGDDPIGLGARVPGLVISPWSRGGTAHDTVVDHSSILQFLEHRFGVEAPLISAWRRATTGDLLDALDFDAYDDSVPDLPDPLPQPVRSAEQCDVALWAGPPDPQAPPTVEA